MSAFELPELYMPYPARLNPNVDSARVHTRFWAEEMGMLSGPRAESGSFCWDAEFFEAHEFALLCGYTHPDLPPSELDLMSDWYVWLFFFDDYFLEAFKRNDDVAGGKQFLARLWDFLPLDPSQPIPAATNPVERGMAQLWTRSTPNTSLDWRRRYVGHTRDTLETVLWEHSNIRNSRVANPLEYIAMRRMVGGCVWAACLLERANGLSLSDELLAARPLRLLHDAFADSEHLHNDLMSYSREVGEEGENANGVLVFERFMGLDPQSAANLSSDVLSARLHQFEHTVLVELPLYFEEQGVPPQQRIDALRYANGLMAWISGAYDWHFHSSRYDLERPFSPTGGTARPDYLGPLGAGTSTTRALQGIGFRTHLRTHITRPGGPRAEVGPAGAPARVTPVSADATQVSTARTHPAPKLSAFPAAARGVGRLEVPSFYMPFAARVNPASERARAHTQAWAESLGMLDGSVWTAQRFAAEAIGLRAGHLLPEAAPAQLELVSQWCAWSLYLNDLCLELFKRRRDLLGAKVFAGRLSSFVGQASGAGLAPSNPAERGLASLWQRTAPRLSQGARVLFAKRVRAYIHSPVWEIFNTLQDRTPDPIDYCEMRRVTGRAELALSLVQIGDELPVAIVGQRMLRQLEEAFCDVTPLRNDIVSYTREVHEEGELLNAVVVLQRFFDTDLAEATAVTNALSRARVEQFEHGTDIWLPELCEDLELAHSERATVERYVERLRSWMAGDLAWSQRSARHDNARGEARPGGIRDVGRNSGPASGPRPGGPDRLGSLARGPTGFGTSAAHIHELMRSKGRPTGSDAAPPVSPSPPVPPSPSPFSSLSAEGEPSSAPLASTLFTTSSPTLDDKLREIVTRSFANPSKP